jgi:predicted phosphodiesterase
VDLKATRRIVASLLVLSCWLVLSAQDLVLPQQPESVRFAVFGDSGTGDTAQYETAEQLVKFHQKFPFTFSLMLGDNMYGSERPQDFEKKFERPYKPLLDAKVDFYAVLGNHDDPNQRFYKPFNMNGQRYYSFKKGHVRFFALDSNYMEPDQLEWLEKELKGSGSDWKIPYFHHPLYSSGMHGSQVELQTLLEPLFIKYGVDVVFAGHEHFYERIKPQQGIWYFTSGGAAKIRRGDIRKTNLTASGFDQDRSFMLVEIAGDQMFFQAVSRDGATIDKGMMRRRETAKPAPVTAAGASPLR